jgi:membrane associated rhomboid family serine protease
MLEDRDYMREQSSPFRFRWSGTAVLALALVVSFIVQIICDAGPKKPIQDWFALTASGLKAGHFWQLLTYQFLHGGIGHLAGNILTLFFIGRYVEQILGSRRYFIAYFTAGIVGGMFQGMLMLIFPERYGGALCGASAGVAGLFAIFAMIERNSKVLLYFFIPIRAMAMLMIFAAISIVFTIFPAYGGIVAHAAHLGGLVTGIIWVKLGWHHDYIALPWEGLLTRWRRWRPLISGQRKRALVRAASVKAEAWKRPETETPDELPAAEFISKEVDPILEKISKHGIHSLTDRERKILEAARKKMTTR